MTILLNRCSSNSLLGSPFFYPFIANKEAPRANLAVSQIIIYVPNYLVVLTLLLRSE